MNLSICIDYSKNNPYQDYIDQCLTKIQIDSNANTYDTSKKFRKAGEFLLTTSVLVLYRVWLIFQDMYFLCQDLFSGEFAGDATTNKESRIAHRFAFNLASILLLDPLYVLAGVIQTIVSLPLVVFVFLPTNTCLSGNFAALSAIEWAPATLYGKLAKALDFDDKKYLENTFTLIKIRPDDLF